MSLLRPPRFVHPPLAWLAAACLASCSTGAVRDEPRSLASDTHALLTFANRSGQTVNIYWIDFGGNRQLYQTLKSGGTFTQQTYLTHPWLVTDSHGRPWHVYFAEVQPRTIVLEAPER